MSEPGSVTRWMFDLAESDDSVARQIWDRYFQRLVGLARRQLKRQDWGGVGEEDVALSALHSFVMRRGVGEFTWLQDRDDLWKLLAVITRRKALNVMRRELTERRGGGQRVEMPLELWQVFESEPTPEQALELFDEVRRLLDIVLARGDVTLRTIATAKFEGADNDELAQRLGVSRRTIERKLAIIRNLCDEDLRNREVQP